MIWQKLSITTHAELADQLGDMVTEADALSVTLEDAKDEPLFHIQLDESPLWQQVKVAALFPENTNLETILEQLHQQLELTKPLHYETQFVEDQDWVRLTQQHFQPQCFGKHLWVSPAWHDDKQLQGYIIKIDPGLAFGTGTHPTTQMCLEWLATHPPENQIVIDYGCGSGILALAALALGATKAYAVDYDSQALEATENNAQLNKFVNKDNLKILLPEKMPEIKAAVVLANILANPLIEMAETLSHFISKQGYLILSGILEMELDAIKNAYQPFLQYDSHKTQENWARIVFKKT